MPSACRIGLKIALRAAAALLALPSFAAPATTRPTDPAEPMWVNHIEPLLQKSCVKCHGGGKVKGGLDLRNQQALFSGGTDGSVVIPGRPAESPLFQRLDANADGHMPPDKEPQLSVEEVSFVREWIAMLPSSADHPPTIGGGAFDQNAPSLIAQATSVKWQPPAGMTATAAIDHLIAARWAELKVTGNDVCDDAAFVRRVYLDLGGRIPTRAEADAFVASPESQKRPVLVDRLLSGPEFARHFAEVLDVALMERKGKFAEASRKSRGWFQYLQTSVAANRPWNDMVADLITARAKAPEQNGAAYFLYERKNNYQAMAEAVAPVAFGVSMACAQCHNHPLAHELKQQHYWGLVAAFNRTANVDGGDKPTLSESAVGGFVKFTNLKRETQPAILALPTGRVIDEKRPAEGAKETDADANYVVPPSKDNKGRPLKAAVPKFSRRQSLADAVTHDNPLLARAFVNRTWAMLLGRGFVNPVDQMDSRHVPSHPELLTFLATDFEQHGYDIKRLVRTIVLSRTYQLDSHWKDATPPQPELFARGLEKSLSAEVLYRSLLVATGRKVTADDKDTADTEALRQSLIVAFPGLFEVEYNATLQQSMFVTNSPLFDALLQPAGDNLPSRLAQLPSSAERVKAAFVEILGRTPDPAEQARAVAYLDARSERPEAGIRQLTWALLTGAEFLMNH